MSVSELVGGLFVEWLNAASVTDDRWLTDVEPASPCGALGSGVAKIMLFGVLAVVSTI